MRDEIRFTHWKKLPTPDVKVSYVITTRHRVRQLLSLLYALQAQTHENIEVIVAHDGLIEGASSGPWSWPDAFDEFEKDKRFKFFVHPVHTGDWGHHIRSIYEQECTGEWIGNMCDDDWCCPVYTEVLLHEATKAQAQFAFCDFVHNHSGWEPHEAKPWVGGIGIGGWICRADLVKANPYRTFGFVADGERASVLVEKSERKVHVKRMMFCHG